MDWNEERLTELSNLASLPSFTTKDIASVFDISYSELSEAINENKKVQKAIESGRLKARAELDKRISTLSKQGSGPAQTLELKMRRARKIDELLERYG